MIKKIILSTFLFFTAFLVFIIWNLHLMEIDDHYGDLQDIYFEAKDEDIIVNKETKVFGVISKDWKRAHVIIPKKDTLDLFELIYIKNKMNKYMLLRPEIELNASSLTYPEIIEMQKKKIVQTVLEN